ncbi:MAG: DUF1573 domain-containing protein [Candidatus Komeilibacteria bacterium]
MIWGRANQTSNGLQNSGAIGSAQVSESSFNFGTISMKDGLVDHIFKITNSTDQDIFVKEIYTSCMCTGAYIEKTDREKGPFGMKGMGYLPPANEIIKVGESLNIKVVYDPNAHGPAGIGTIDRLIYLTDASGGELQLEIEAVVTP